MVHTVSKMMKNVMRLTSESEVGSLFHNGQEAEHILTTPKNMGHPQPETPH